MHWLFAPGFFASGTEHTALGVSGFVAVVTGVVGVFVVLRQQSFTGHALTDVATAGGSGAFLLGWPILSGFVTGGLLGSAAIEAVGADRVKDRDLATGIVLGAASGASALFLYLTANSSSTTGGTQQILFGSVVAIPAHVLLPVYLLGLIALLLVGLVARPLLLSSLSSELAAARGVHQRLAGAVFMGAVAVAVGLASIVLGSVLATALLIGPAAAAGRVASSVRRAMIYAVMMGAVSTSLGILLSYDSYNWSTSHRHLPVSFFVVVNVVLFYFGSSLFARRATRRTERAARS